MNKKELEILSSSLAVKMKDMNEDELLNKLKELNQIENEMNLTDLLSVTSIVLLKYLFYIKKDTDILDIAHNLEYQLQDIEENAFFTGKIICISNNKDESFADNFTVGKVYEVVDGIIIDDEGLEFGDVNSFQSLEEINDFFRAQFINLVD